MALGLRVIAIPISHDLGLKLGESFVDGGREFFDEHFEVSALFFDFIGEIKSFFVELFVDFFLVGGQFETLDVGVSVLLEVDKFLVHFFLHFFDILLFAPGV